MSPFPWGYKNYSALFTWWLMYLFSVATQSTGKISRPRGGSATSRWREWTSNGKFDVNKTISLPTKKSLSLKTVHKTKQDFWNGFWNGHFSLVLGGYPPLLQRSCWKKTPWPAGWSRFQAMQAMQWQKTSILLGKGHLIPLKNDSIDFILPSLKGTYCWFKKFCTSW